MGRGGGVRALRKVSEVAYQRHWMTPSSEIINTIHEAELSGRTQ